jgi:hypothetical protein
MENAISDIARLSELPPRYIDFAEFALRYSYCCQSLLHGELSVRTLEKIILPKLQAYARQSKKLYYQFLLLNLINAYIKQKNYINNKTSEYYSSLFDAQEFSGNKLDNMFNRDKTAKITRLQAKLTLDQETSEAFENINVFNLYPLLENNAESGQSAMPPESSKKLIKYLCILAGTEKIKGKDIVFDIPFTNEAEKIKKLQEALIRRLENSTNADFLDTDEQKFLGYRYYIIEDHGYIKIYLKPD